MFITLPNEYCKMLGKDKTEKYVRPFFDPFQWNFKNPHKSSLVESTYLGSKT